jgi:pimeloyl-ACP methyl ester carboxylesterase
MRALVRDGVRLAYDEHGRGDPPLVFIHGWCCVHTHWDAQVARFSPAHRTVAVDLRGHGDSDRPEQDYTIEGFADDVAWMCGELGVEKPVVVGHSMGGSTALALADRHPSLPAAIVMLDTSLFIPRDVAASARPLGEAFAGDGAAEALRQFADQRFFIATDDPARRRAIVDAIGRSTPHVAGSAFAALLDYDSEAALRNLRMPSMYVAADPTAMQWSHLRKLCPEMVLGATTQAGHFHQIEAADQVNAMLERFLRIHVPSAASAK